MKTKFYIIDVKFYKSLLSKKIVSPTLVILCVALAAIPSIAISQISYLPAQDKIEPAKNEAVEKRLSSIQTLQQNANTIWFEKNEGQFDKNVQYGFRTSFGIIGVYNNKLRMVVRQGKDEKTTGYQVVDICFPGSNRIWDIVTGAPSDVKGTYNINKKNISPSIYNELLLKNVYNGADLRLYTGKNGSLEFDWMLAKGNDFDKIRMMFTGQDRLLTDKDGSLVIKLRYDNINIRIPETYQLINGTKKVLPAGMALSGNKNTVHYTVSGDIEREKPLVIDPVMSWSTYMHNNSSTFDEYLYAVAANANDEIYACGLTNEAMSSTYLSNVAPGYSGTYTFGLNSSNARQTAILYKLNSGGTAITAWTYTGLNANVPVAMGIFPDNRVLVLYMNDSVQIFSADLTTRHYSGVVSAGVAASVANYQSLAIANDSTFYLGGIATRQLPDGIIPANAPDVTLSASEGVILKVTAANTATPVFSWGTYVGGTSKELFTAIALTPDKSKLAFAVHADAAGNNYPALVNAVDNTISNSELLVGVIDFSNLTAFKTFSYLGGSGNEGTASTISAAALVAADNDYFYVAGNTTSSSLPGASNAAQPSHGANARYADQFISRIPLNGSAVSGFATSFNGGNDVDLVGGLVIDYRTSSVLLFGTTVSSDFPVYSPNPVSPYYQSQHGSFEFGTRDITYTIFQNDLADRIYSTYIGGSYDDYLGSTGKLEGTGHFQYSTVTGLTYIGTTIHSDQNSLPSQWMSGIPGFDKMVPPATRSKDSHFIFAINPNTNDYGDAPLNYDSTNPAFSAVSYGEIRMGGTVDAEPKPNNSAMANGDDLLNYGSADDEDGVVTAPSMFAFTTSYAVTVSVYNNTGRRVQLCGWIDTDGNGVFDTYEYASVSVPSRDMMQDMVLNFTGLPPFVPMSGKTFLRLRISNLTMTSSSAKGMIGKGEVEDYIVPQAVILPIKIETFTANRKDETVLLNWKVANETDARLYEVEHSTDNRTFEKIGSQTPGSISYNLVHFTPAEGNNYYRIKTYGADGSISYSPSRLVQFVTDKSINIHPNPARDFINIRFDVPQKAVTINVIAADGKTMAKKWIASTGNTETIDASGFSKGYYFVQIQTASGTVTKTVQVTH